MVEKFKNEVSHNCSDCAFKKKIIVNVVDKEDVDVYETIMTGISTAQVAKDPGIIGDDVSVEKMTAFFNAAMDKEAHYKKLEIEWWRKMLIKYKISDRTKIDVMKGQFYVCADEEGKEYVDFKPGNVAKAVNS